jgi:hypothetical protein
MIKSPEFCKKSLLSFFITGMLLFLDTGDHLPSFAQTTATQTSLSGDQALRPIDIDSLLLTNSPEERALIASFVEKARKMAVSLAEKGYQVNLNGRLDFLNPLTFETEKPDTNGKNLQHLAMILRSQLN